MNMLGAPKYTVNMQRREQERVARKKERRIRWWEHWEQRDEEYRLHEQQGLSPPVASEYSSSSEEEGVMGGGLPPRSGILRPLTESCRCRRGAGARGGRGSTRHRAVRGRSGARRGSTGACLRGIWECCGDGDKRPTLEEDEARLLDLEVSGRSSRCSSFEGLALSPLLSCSQGGADRPRACAC
jgi:hypothetical protein